MSALWSLRRFAARHGSLALVVVALVGCKGATSRGGQGDAPAREQVRAVPGEDAVRGDVLRERADERARMVEEQLARRGIAQPEVLAAMRAVPRHVFVPEGQRALAYEDRPLAIGEDQTISQPYVVALMTELARVDAGSRVLEIGTGSGYQAAVLAEVAGEVYTIEIVEALGARARKTLTRLGYEDVHTRIGDGYQGWPEAAPFDAILVTAAPPAVPEPLKQQLAVGGRLVVPVGEGVQELLVITRTREGFQQERVASVMFVPMTGEAQAPR